MELFIVSICYLHAECGRSYIYQFRVGDLTITSLSNVLYSWSYQKEVRAFLSSFGCPLISIILTLTFLSLFKTYKAAHALSLVCSTALRKDWTFLTNNKNALWNSLNPEEQILFCFEQTHIKGNKDVILENMIMGIRTYVLKDPLETLSLSRKKLNR